MKQITVAVLLLTALAGLGSLAVAESLRPAFHEETGRAVGEVVDQFRGLGAQLERHLRGAPGARPPAGLSLSQAERPLISIMLDHRDELALTPEQTARLERLRNDFAREEIRRDADIRIAEMDLAALLEQELLDMSKVEAKIREVAKLHADLRVERLRTIEQGKAVLTAEQRSKLRSLLGMAGRPRRTADRGTQL